VRPLSRPRRRRPELLAALLLLTACGASAPAPARASSDEEDPLAAAQRQVQSLTQQLQSLQTENAALRARLDAAEQRLGLVPYRPAALKPLQGDGRALEAGGDSLYVGEAGGRPAKRNLAKTLGSADVTVVSFWATWCGPCTSDAELEHLRHLETQLARHGVGLVSLAVDEVAKVQGHAKADRWLYPLWQRQDGHLKMLPRALMEKVGVGLPVFLVVDRAGQVAWYRNQALDEAAVGELVTAALDVRSRP
jgi:thiol-disulfide isomerase/thioredoxin